MSDTILKARGLFRYYGSVVALGGADFDLTRGEILGIIGDNGAGKTTLIKILSGAEQADEGMIEMEGRQVSFESPVEAHAAGVETVYQTLALSPALSISDNLFLGREIRRKGFLGRFLRALDHKEMQRQAQSKLTELGILTVQDITQAVETLSGGQRQGVAVARAAAFGSKIVIMDEPTAALGVRESRQVLELIQEIKSRGVSVVLISHNMPHVFEICDRVHIHRLGKRLCVVSPEDCTSEEAVAYMTGAKEPAEELAGSLA